MKQILFNSLDLTDNRSNRFFRSKKEIKQKKFGGRMIFEFVIKLQIVGLGRFIQFKFKNQKMTKTIFECPIFGCLEQFTKKCHLTLHLQQSCSIKKKLGNFRQNGSPLYRKPQKIRHQSIRICQQTIGKGSYGQIYPAELGCLKLVAKLIRKQTSLRVQNEVYAKLWKDSIPRGIPRFYGMYDQVHGGAFLITQRLDFTLWDLLRDHTFNQQELVMFLLQMTKILEVFHTKGGYVHRDIKQNNVMFSDGVIYIIDFGLAIQKPRFDDAPIDKTSKGNMFLLDLRGHRNVWQDCTSDLQTVGFMAANLCLKKGLPWVQTYKDFKSGKLTYGEANQQILEEKQTFLRLKFHPLPKYLWDYLDEVSFKPFGCHVDYRKLITKLETALKSLPKHQPCWKKAKLPPSLPSEQLIPITNFSGMKHRFDVDDLTRQMQVYYVNEYGIPMENVCSIFFTSPQIKEAGGRDQFNVVFGVDDWDKHLKDMRQQQLDCKLFLYLQRYDPTKTQDAQGDKKRQYGESHQYGLYLVYRSDVFSFVNDHDLSKIFPLVKRSKYWKSMLVSSSGYHCFFWIKQIIKVGLVQWAKYEE